jgi:transposase-like protein
MPAAKRPEFRHRAVDLARSGDPPVAKIASDLGISESCLMRWMAVDDVASRRREGLTSTERKELVALRRQTRVQAMEIEILKRASASPGRACSQRMTPLVLELAADGEQLSAAIPTGARPADDPGSVDRPDRYNEAGPDNASQPPPGGAWSVCSPSQPHDAPRRL